MNRMINYMFFLMLFWIIAAEKMDFERGWIGIGICTLSFFFNKDIIVSKTGKDLYTFKKIYYLPMYLFILIKEIIIANFQVAKIVLTKNMNISPQVVIFHSKLKTDFYRMILANSITLTPGTLTIFMEENQLIVHCLKKEYIEDVLNSKFEKILLEIEE